MGDGNLNHTGNYYKVNISLFRTRILPIAEGDFKIKKVY